MSKECYLFTPGKCTNPTLTSQVTYNTPDVLLSRDTVHSVSLTLTCGNNEVIISVISAYIITIGQYHIWCLFKEASLFQQPSLYAYLDDELVPLTKEPGTGNYQV